MRTTIGGLVGNILEWYDFAVYGALAENIGFAFFPTDCDPAAAVAVANATAAAITTAAPGTAADTCADGNLIESFAVFGGAFLMRPLGYSPRPWLGLDLHLVCQSHGTAYLSLSLCL